MTHPVAHCHTVQKELHQTRWSLEEDETRMANMVVSVIDELVTDQASRRNRSKANLQAYMGHSVQNLDARTYARPDVDVNGITLRIAQSVVDTGKAKIASRQRPKPVVVTKGGSYKQRIRARKKTKFLEAQLHRPHGMYSNGWQLMEQVFKDCELWEAGVVKCVADNTEKRPVLERCFSFDIYFDDLEAEYGCPKNLFHRYRYDRHNLCARFPELKSEIMEAQEYETEGYTHRNRDMVAVYEAWRLPFGPDKPGRHVIALKTRDGGVKLVNEPWERQGFPFYFMTWERHQFGLWGMPLIEQIMEPQEEANSTFSFIQEQVKLGGSGFLEVDQNGHEMGDVESNEAWHIIRRTSDTAQPIKVHSPPAFNQSVLQWAESMKALCYELPGVSEMSAQGKKEAGVTSGVAIRTVNDLTTERFLPKAKDYEQSFVAIGKLMLWAMEDLSKEFSDSELTALLPGADSIQEFTWEDVKLEEYEVQMQPASSFPDTPAGKLQAISEFAEAGYIGPETARRLMSQSAPDIDALNERETAQYRYIEQLISEMQEADEDDEEEYEADVPDPLLNLESAIVQMTMGYYEMLKDRAPEYNKRLLRNWISAADDILSDAANPPEPPVTDPGMPPEAMPPEGMPMDPSMMGGPPMPMDPAMQLPPPPVA